MERLFDSIEATPEPVSAALTGKLPAWLKGNLYRLGPAKWDADDFTLRHWFDGCAMIYRFHIEDGKVTFRSRFLNSDMYNKFTTIHRPVFTEFGTKSYPDPCKNVFTRFFSQLLPGDLTDNDVGNVFPMADELYCSSETCYMWRVDPETLDSLDKVDIGKLVSVNLASSHPQKSRDGNTYNLGASFTTGLKYHIIKIPPVKPSVEVNDKKGPRAFSTASVLCTIPSSWNTCFSYYHSFAMSENYIVFLEQPLLVNTIKLAGSAVQGLSLKECFDWVPKEKAKFYVIERTTGHVSKTRYQSEAFFTFHQMNAFEDEGQLVVDLITFENAEVIDKFYLEKLRAGLFEDTSPPTPQRFVLPLEITQKTKKGENLVSLNYTTATAIRQENGTVYLKPEDIGPSGFELPVMNPEFSGRRYRYAYCTGVFEKGRYRNSICKLDVSTKRVDVWRGEDTMYPSEVTFLPRPGAVEEDDGILLSVVVDARPESQDFLMVLDAKNLEVIARAEVTPSVRIPSTIHGCFLAQ